MEFLIKLLNYLGTICLTYAIYLLIKAYLANAKGGK